MRLRWDETASPAQIAAIATQIDAAGYCRLDDFLHPDERAALAAHAMRAVDRAGGKYVEFTGTAGFDATIWPAMRAHPALRALCVALYIHATGRPAPAQDFHQVVRCLTGATAARHSLRFHFDSYVLAILLPIAIPDHGPRGDFVLFPDARPIRRSYWRNVADKLVIDRAPLQWLYRRRARRRAAGIVAVPMVPGSAVLFWGYRALHANEPCDPRAMRATALLHFGNPHR